MTTNHSSNALQSNLEVDYVINYRFLDTDKTAAQAQFEELIQALARVGLQTEVRNGENGSLLVFVNASDARKFSGHVYRSRVNDWLHGIRFAQPDREAHGSLTAEPLTEAERYRLIYGLITGPRSEGGAEITPKAGKWKQVESVFPLHDNVYNKAWIKKWSTKTFLTAEDLDEIRNRLGEKIAFYFAFTQSYFAFLLFPAAFGFSAWVLLPSCSWIYGALNVLGCVTFVEYWKRQEQDLGVRWGVKGVAAYQERRKEFHFEKQTTDPLTGEPLYIYPATKRLGRQALAIPFGILVFLALGTVIATCFGIEVFLSEVYNGPGKGALVFLPTGLIVTINPILITLLTQLATKLNDYENYETKDAYENALTRKLFMLNFVTSYLGIFLTAFVYVPFGRLIVPYLDIFHLTARPFATSEGQLKTPPPAAFEISTTRLRKQVIYFTVTAQIINLALEVVIPYLKRRGFHKVQELKTARAARRGGAVSSASISDPPEEVEFLTRVRNEAQLEVYDVTSDLREMVVQFGYLALFSVVWPLVPVSFIINNWIELRSDAVKICVEMQRPTPSRADSIGPWLDSLGFLTWLGSITTAAIVYLFSNDGLGPDGTPATIQGWALLLTILLSEHLYLLVRWVVRLAISKIDSPGMVKERDQRLMVRKRYLQETLGEKAMELPPSGSSLERFTRESLEDDAREMSRDGVSKADRFWGRQRGWEESVQFGKAVIERMGGIGGEKEGKKLQ